MSNTYRHYIFRSTVQSSVSVNIKPDNSVSILQGDGCVSLSAEQAKKLVDALFDPDAHPHKTYPMKG